MSKLDSSDRNLKITSVILQVIAIVIASLSVIVATYSISIATQSLDYSYKAVNISEKSLSFTTRPAKIIFEVDHESTSAYFDHERKIYRIAHIPEIQNDRIHISIWNVGAQTAENVRVGILTEPQSSDFYASGNARKCIALQCFNHRSNPVEFRAIEPNGYYSMSADYSFNSTITLEKDPAYLVMTIEYFDSQENQKIQTKYKIQVD